jgi:ABC-type uncharacterized transport system auxiliary subunit
MLILLALAISGCLSRAPLKKETLAFSTNLSPHANEVENGGVLVIRSLQVTPPFEGQPLVYRTGEFSYEQDPYSMFLNSPASLLIPAIGDMLVNDGCFKAVVKPGSAVKPDTLAEINVSQLYGDIRQPKKPSAVLAMQVVFMNATNGMPGRIILQKNYSSEIPIKSTSPTALMEGWNQALQKILAEVESDFTNRAAQKVENY